MASAGRGEHEEDGRRYVSLAGLRMRGWAGGMVHRLLGPPDRLSVNPRVRAAPPVRLYRVERVEAAERGRGLRPGRTAVPEKLDALPHHPLDDRQVVRHPHSISGAPMIRRVTAHALFPPPTYSHASVVEAGTKLAFLAGAVPLDAQGSLVGEGDPVRQAQQVLANLEEQLRAIGSDLAHVLATDVYVVSQETSVLSAVWEVVEASGLSTGPHSSTLIGVACLGYSGQLVEITATAAIPEEA
ncbi:RidA family protein [Streptomyces sp. NPDC057280]|uniref:RidA family protein n=1 Tax=Streptomyces sp. NPDC057280 TaxID=3346081 RepID=UPI0026D0B744